MPDQAARLRFREVRLASDPVLAAVYRLLRRTFSERELVRRRDLREMLVERNSGLLGDLTWHMIVAERGSQLVGVATISYLGNVNVGVIGYLAVRSGERSVGVGLKLRARLLRVAHRDALTIHRRPLEAIVGEVRPGNPWLAHLVEHFDAIPLDFEYWQPSIDGTAKPVRLILYYQPLLRDRKSLGVDEVRRLIYHIWRRLYRIPKPMKVPNFQRMLKSLAGRRRIGSRSPAGLK